MRWLSNAARRSGSLWPSTQRRLDNALQFSTRGPSSSLHGHAIHHRRHEAGQISWIRINRQITLNLCAPQPVANCQLELPAAQGELLANRSSLFSAGQRALYGQATGRIVRPGLRFCRAPEQAIDGSARSLFLECLADVGHGAANIPIQRLSE